MSDLFVKAVKDYKKRVIRDFLIWDLIMLITAPVYAFCVEGINMASCEYLEVLAYLKENFNG